MAHRLHPAQPLATGFVFTLPRQLPRRTDASAIGVQPQTDQELWVGVLSSCAAFHRGNLLVIAAQIQSPHQLPNRTYAVIVIYQLLYIHRPQEHLPTINRYQPRNSRRVAHHVRSLHTSTQPTATNFFTRSRPAFSARAGRLYAGIHGRAVYETHTDSSADSSAPEHHPAVN